MQSKVSVRGQTVIPAPIRQALHIEPNQKLSWHVRDGVAVVRPMPADPLRASIGILKGAFTFEEFMEERNRDRELERAHDREMERAYGVEPAE